MTKKSIIILLLLPIFKVSTQQPSCPEGTFFFDKHCWLAGRSAGPMYSEEAREFCEARGLDIPEATAMRKLCATGKYCDNPRLNHFVREGNSLMILQFQESPRFRKTHYVRCLGKPGSTRPQTINETVCKSNKLTPSQNLCWDIQKPGRLVQVVDLALIMTWQKAKKFCSRKGGRLPTLAEWKNSYSQNMNESNISQIAVGEEIRHNFSGWNGIGHGDDLWTQTEAGPKKAFAIKFPTQDPIGEFYEDLSVKKKPKEAESYTICVFPPLRRARIDDGHDVEKLVLTIIENKDERKFKEAKRLLLQLRAKAVPALVQKLGKSPNVYGVLVKAHWSTTGALIRELNRAEGEAAERLFAILRTWSKASSRHHRPFFPKFFPELLPLLEHTQAEKRYYALQLISGQRNLPKKIESAALALTADRDAKIRAMAFKALATIDLPEPKRTEAIVKGLSDENASVKITVAENIPKLQSEEKAVPLLLAMLEGDAATQTAGLNALATMKGSSQISKSLSSFILTSSNRTLRMRAIELIRVYGPTAHSLASVLIQIIKNEETDDGMRLEAAVSLGFISDDHAKTISVPIIAANFRDWCTEFFFPYVMSFHVLLAHDESTRYLIENLKSSKGCASPYTLQLMGKRSVEAHPYLSAAAQNRELDEYIRRHHLKALIATPADPEKILPIAKKILQQETSVTIRGAAIELMGRHAQNARNYVSDILPFLDDIMLSNAALSALFEISPTPEIYAALPRLQKFLSSDCQWQCMYAVGIMVKLNQVDIVRPYLSGFIQDHGRAAETISRSDISEASRNVMLPFLLSGNPRFCDTYYKFAAALRLKPDNFDQVAQSFFAGLSSDECISLTAELAGDLQDKLGKKGVAPLLRALGRSKKDYLATWAEIQALRKYGSVAQEALPTLRQMTQDPNPYTRYLAREAIRAIEKSN